jgi:parallel beta-helix repeat protein
MKSQGGQGGESGAAGGAAGAAGLAGAAGATGLAGAAGGPAGATGLAGAGGGAGAGGTAGVGAAGGGGAGSTGAGGATSCPTTAATTGTRYVDHAAGTDDGVHGGGPGACAFKTLTYAISKAPGEISLSAADTYQGDVAGESLPFLLQGKQTLTCNGATLASSTAMGTYDGIVQFAGTANGVTGCSFNGEKFGGYCLLVNTSAASSAAPHTITQSTFTGCDNVTIVVGSGFDNVSITNNVFTLDFDCIYVMGSPSDVNVSNNTFVGTTTDVLCGGADPGVTGSGNSRGGGTIVCTTCGNCPF